MKANNFVAYSYRTLIDHLFEFQFQTLNFVLTGHTLFSYNFTFFKPGYLYLQCLVSSFYCCIHTGKHTTKPALQQKCMFNQFCVDNPRNNCLSMIFNLVRTHYVSIHTSKKALEIKPRIKLNDRQHLK